MRHGLNASLTYVKGKNQQGYRVRVTNVQHGMKVIYTESSARVRRVLYPHRLSSAQFSVTVQLVGEAEYISFSDWMAAYAEYVLNQPSGAPSDFPFMTVSVPSRNFLRYGVPLTGFTWGDKVGGMLWEQQLAFETAREPGEAQPPLLSAYRAPIKGYQTSQYFYPSGQQLSGANGPPEGTYPTPIGLSDIVDPSTLPKGDPAHQTMPPQF